MLGWTYSVSVRRIISTTHQTFICCREIIPLTPHPEKGGHPYLLLAQWTPRGHGVVMVQDYDIYYITGPMSNTGYRVTNTAIPGILSNGLPDWLYEGNIIHIFFRIVERP